jgi:hypothetical protein
MAQEITMRLRFYRGRGWPGEEINANSVTGNDRAVLEVEGFGPLAADPRDFASGRLQHLLNYVYRQGRIAAKKEIAAALSITAEEIA